jgi:two-component sensor histidine kinase
VPRVDGFIPAILTIVFVADLITAVLLFNQSSLTASRALLVLANGYLFSALIVIPHALTFPGAFAPKGLLGASAQSSAWLNVFWNLGFIVAVAGYTLLKDHEYRKDAIPPSTLSPSCWSAAIQIGLICALTWAVTAGDWFMPRMFLDDLRPAPLLHYVAGTIVLLSVLAVLLIWTRLMSVLDLWVMFALSMLITEKTLVTFGMTTRFSLGWYVSRALVVAVSIAVLIVLLSELMRLHVNLLRSRNQLRTLNAELDHRVKNVLAIIQAVAARTLQASGSMEHFAAALDGRIRSMGSVHELLSHRRWLGIPLADLVERELAPFATGSNTEIGGPEVILRAEAAQTMATVLHELVTNAAKYGALSASSERVSIKWRLPLNGSGSDRLVLIWRESGGPLVVPRSKSGYGMDVIRCIIPYELGGTVDHVLAPEGARCQMEISLAQLAAGSSQAIGSASAALSLDRDDAGRAGSPMRARPGARRCRRPRSPRRSLLPDGRPPNCSRGPSIPTAGAAAGRRRRHG